MFALWLAFFLPILPATLGWVLLLDPTYGIINTYTEKLVGMRVLDIYSLAGITWVHLTLSTVPIMVILIEPAQRLIDISYEEASILSGASVLTTLRRVTVPLIAPTLLTAFILESVNRIINVAFKFVPLRTGVDEAGTGMLSKVLGFTTAIGVTLAIVRKGRDIFWTGIGVLLLVRRGLSVRGVTSDSEELVGESSTAST